MKVVFLILFTLFSLNAINQVKWNSKVSETVGFTNNLFLAPSKYTGQGLDTVTDFRKNAYFNKFSFSNDIKFTLKKKRFINISPWIQSTIYPSESQANAMLFKTVFDYKMPLTKKLDLNIGFTLEKNKKLTIDILTDDGVNTYDYFLYTPSTVLTYKIKSNFKIEFSNMIGDKTYKPMQSGQNFSHWFHTHVISGIYRHKLKNYFQLDLKYHKQYFDYLKMEINNNEPIDWRYLTIYGSYKYKVNKDKYITVFSQFYNKTDFDKADFSFWQWSNGITGELKVKKIGFTSSLNAIYRNYLKRTAFIESNVKYDSTLLKYTYLNFAFSAKYYLKDNFELVAGIFSEMRLTNSIREDKMYRRPYETYTITLGLVYNFQLENKKSKIPDKVILEDDELLSSGMPDLKIEDDENLEELEFVSETSQEIEKPLKSQVELFENTNKIDSLSFQDSVLIFKDEMFYNIELETGKNNINETSLLQLVLLAKALTDNSNTQLQITGFTDDIGSISDNLKLSRERAESVAKVLIENGVSEEQILIKFEGERNPISSNSNELGRQKNRRVELKLIIR